MSSPHALVDAFAKFSRYPLGAWLLTRIVCWRAPYFASISPIFMRLEPGIVEVRVKKRRKVHNHIGTVHAIAMANACELAAGVASEVTVPRTMRWIPKGMTIEYLCKAQTSIIARATFDKTVLDSQQKADVVVPVHVYDEHENVVVRADITMYVSPK